MHIIFPLLMVFSIAMLRAMRHKLEREEERAEAVRGGDFVCEYREYGGMADRSVTMTLTANSAGARLAVAERDGPRAEETREEFALPPFASDALVEIYLERGVCELKKLKRSELIALDAPTRKLRFETAVGETEIDGDDELPKRCGALFPDVTAELGKWRDLFKKAKAK